MKQKMIIEIICFLLVFLFVYAALSKLFNYDEFTDQLGRSPLVRNFSTTIAIVLPAAELIVAVMLTIKSLRKFGLVGSTLLITTFTFYILYMLLFEKHLPCSCGGVLKQMTWNQHLLFNIFFLIIAIIGFVFEKNKNKSQTGS